MEEQLMLYLDGMLEPDQQAALEAQLAADAALKARWENLRLAREAVRQYGLRETVASVHQEMMPGLRRRHSSVRRIIRYSLAAAATLLLIVGGVLAWNFYQLSPERVYTSAYQPYEISNTRDGGAEPGQIESAFREANYEQVLNLSAAQPVLTTREQLLKGLACLELRQWADAVTVLSRTAKEAAKQQEPLLQQEAEYYRALALLRNGDIDFALDQFQQIYDNPSHAYHDKVSRRLLRRVRLLKWR